ncbi:hypothetical protein [Butyrivibrio sp. NC3005]|uniref:hypothetical protein n=1 Tax=Butyrivibrio sp. NC3005 TaxID=1280685 RepID=UPI00041068C7|nr:hypothetical protein [Butyrivibrio sp. NC3005]
MEELSAKKPDIILRLSAPFSEFDQLERRNVTKTQIDEYEAYWNKTKMAKELDDGDYLKESVDCGVVYRRSKAN